MAVARTSITGALLAAAQILSVSTSSRRPTAGSVPRREFADVTRDLKPIYTRDRPHHAHQELEGFDEKWGARLPVITQAWLDRWEYVTPFWRFRPRSVA